MTNMERPSPPPSPYRGIHQFRYMDQALFFGREEAISGLLVKVLLARLVVVFGESGAGKSSIINAGLVPALEKERFRPERLLVRPDSVTPILIDRIQSGNDKNRGYLPSVFVPTEMEGSAGRVPCTLKQFSETIRKCVSRALTSSPIYPVLIFDQFEELFTLFDQGKQELQREILRAIFDIINDDSLKAKVVITIREDFVGKLEVLAKSYPRVFDHRVRLQPLDSENATKAILDPFGKNEEDRNFFRSRLTSGLAERIILEFCGEQKKNCLIPPTQLQIVCSRLWDEYAAREPQITPEHFAKLGGLKGIIEGYLNSELSELDRDMRRQAVMVLGTLITDAGTRDIVNRDRLRRSLVPERMTEAALVSTISFLENRRLISGTPQRDTYYYEVASEYLIPAIHGEAQVLEGQLTIEREQKRLREEAERGAQARVEKDLRRRLGWAWTFGALTALCVIVAGGVAYRNWHLARRNWDLSEQLGISLKKEQHLSKQLVTSLESERDLKKQTQYLYDHQRELTKQLEYANKTLAKEKSAVENERTKAIAGELGQRALNRLAGEPGLSNLLALQSVLLARHAQNLNGSNQPDPEAHGTFQRVGQALRSTPRLLFERGFSTMLPGGGKIDRIMKFSGDGTRLATGGDDGVVRVWDAVHGQLLLNLQFSDGAATRVLDISFTPDGERVIAVGSDSLIKVWNTRSGELELAPDKEERDQLTRDRVTRVNQAMLADDGRRYSVIANDGSVRVWQLTDTGRRSRDVSIECPSSHVSMSPNGELIACADESGVVKIHSPFGERQIRTGYRATKKLVFTPDSQGVVVINSDGKFALFDVTANRLVWQNTHEGIAAASFGQNGRFLATGSRDGTVQFLDARKGKVLHTLRADIGPVVSITMSRDGRRVAASGESRLTKLWEFSLAGYPDEATNLALSSDGRKIAIGTRNGAVRVAFVNSGRELALYASPRKAAALGLAFSPDASRLAIGFEDGSADILDIWSGRKITELQRQQVAGNPVHSIAFSPDGTRVATGDEYGNVEMWDARTGKRQVGNDEQYPAAIYSIAFDQEGTRLLTGNEVGIAAIFNPQTLKIISATRPVAKQDLKNWVRGPEEITKVEFGEDGKQFMAVRRTRNSIMGNAVAEIWAEYPALAKLEFSVPSKPKDTAGNSLIGAAFRPDGRLITVADNGAVKIWKVTRRGRQQEQTVMESFPGGRNITFDNSGKVFAFATNADAVGLFTFDHDLALEWSLMELSQSSNGAECKNYQQSMAATCLHIAKVLRLVATANSQLTDRNWNQAIATYKEAQNVYPALPKDLTVRLKRLIAETLLVDGRDMARVGREKEGLAALSDARRYDPGLMSDPENALKLLTGSIRDDKRQTLADVKRGQGEREAKRGDLEAAIKYFKEAQQLSPNLFPGGDFEAEAKRLVARGNFNRGTQAAQDENLEAAMRYFTEARVHDPNLFAIYSPELQVRQIVASNRINRGAREAEAGRIVEALREFAEAQKLDPNTGSPESWNLLCWSASLHGYAAAVVDDACMRAVDGALALGRPAWEHRDSRGVARAMVGRTKEAIEDFRELAAISPNPTHRARRQRWIEEISRGENPFTRPEEIEELKVE